MKRMLKRWLISILMFLGRFNYIFIKAAKVLEVHGAEHFLARTKLFIQNKLSCRLYQMKKTTSAADDFIQLKRREFLPQPDFGRQPTAAFTIVSKNYMQYALTLRESFLKHNARADFVIVLLDMFRSAEELRIFQELREKGVEFFSVHELKNKLGDFNLEAMLFKYDILEMNTAIKPFVLEYFCSAGYDRVVYIDPDIYFTSGMDKLLCQLDYDDIILTPHALKPFPDDKSPDDLTILCAGTFNLGFIAVKNNDNTVAMCRWWQEKLFDQCFNDLPKGLFVDQKWMDLVPSYFSKVKVWRSPAYNMAYWNLHERLLTREGESWTVDGEKLVFFHFSGLPLENIDAVSKHQTRYRLRDFPAMRPLFEEYRNAVRANGYDLFRSVCAEYYFAYLPGTKIKIPDLMRRSYYRTVLEELDNPYKPDKKSLNDLLNSLRKKEGGLSRWARAIYRQRDDLQAAFPDIDGSGRADFVNWLNHSAVREYGIAELLLTEEGFDGEKELVNIETGFNLVGYFSNIIGTAESSRTAARQLYGSGIPFSLFLLNSDAHEKISPEEARQYSRYYSESPIFKQNIFFINADSIVSLKNYYPDLFREHYNIAVWWWEFNDYFEFPEAFKCVDEVWVMTDFIKEAVLKAAPPEVRVRKMTYPFMQDWNITADRKTVRSKYKIGLEDYVFYFNFDFLSSYERKNPEMLIQAFAEFARDKADVKLILKTMHSSVDNSSSACLMKLIEDSGLREKVVLINEGLSRDELMSIMDASDCYVSLHRSEGLGLGMLEAMYLGKPVIGTGFGGNLDFMNKNNSLLLDYKLTEVKANYGPYRRGWLWAEPDAKQAAEYMNRVYGDRKWAAALGQRARADVQQRYSAAAFYRDVSQAWTEGWEVE